MGKWNDFVESIKYGIGLQPSVETEVKVTEERLVSYYSIDSIFWFSTILTTIFGSILMAINLNEKGRKREINWVLVFGFLFGLCQLFIVATTHNMFLHIASDLTGYYVLKLIFWEKYIHPEVDYVRKSIYKPLVIGIPIGIIKLLLLPHEHL